MALTSHPLRLVIVGIVPTVFKARIAALEEIDQSEGKGPFSWEVKERDWRDYVTGHHETLCRQFECLTDGAVEMASHVSFPSSAVTALRRKDNKLEITEPRPSSFYPCDAPTGLVCHVFWVVLKPEYYAALKKASRRLVAPHQGTGSKVWILHDQASKGDRSCALRNEYKHWLGRFLRRSGVCEKEIPCEKRDGKPNPDFNLKRFAELVEKYQCKLAKLAAEINKQQG